jgi:hypothetical protein
VTRAGFSVVLDRLSVIGVVERDDVKMLEPEPEEQKVIREMVREHKKGATVYRVRQLAEERGYPLNKRTVAKILERESSRAPSRQGDG